MNSNQYSYSKDNKNPRERNRYQYNLGKKGAFKGSPTVKSDKEEETSDLDSKREDIDDFEENDYQIPVPKSLRLIARDFGSEHWLEIIIAFLISGMLFGLVIPQNRELGVVSTKVDSLKTDISNLDTKYGNLETANLSQKELLIGFQKDIEFLKEKVNSLY